MTQEEKAKAYDNALEIAKEEMSKDGIKNDVIVCEVMKKVFPELAMSKDEKIRKVIYGWICTQPSQFFDNGFSKEEMLAWLEKQGEQSDSDVKDYNSIDPHFGKSIDKIEPKFKVGDWIVFNGLTLYIKEIVKGYYRTISKGGITNSYDWDIDKVARLWTIKDAKSGDVLVTKKNNIFIFNSIINCTIYDYCGLYFGEFSSYSAPVNSPVATQLPIDYVPATKEQREQLEKAMADAGYTFDFEKKELKLLISNGGDFVSKNCEQKPTDEEMKELLRTEYEKGRADAIAEMQVAWSEEDEKMLNNIDITFFEENSIPNVMYWKFMNWLKSLKDRVVQPKVELTQLDKNILEAAIAFVEQNKAFNYWGGVDKHTVLSALHSLRHQSTWKPNDEQMNILYKYAEQNNKDGSILTSLYQDLKKLREE